MELKRVLKAIQEIENKLNNQGIVKDAKLENQLDNLNQVAYEIIKKEIKMQEMVALKQRLDSANINQVYNKDALKTAFTSLEAYPNDINEITQELDDMWTTLSASLDQLQTTNRNLLTIVERLSRDLKDTKDNI